METFLSHLKYIGIWILISIILIAIGMVTNIMQIISFVSGISLIALGFYIFWFLGFLPSAPEDKRYKSGHKPENNFVLLVNVIFGLPAFCSILLGIGMIVFHSFQ